jgi:hypothetical protein
MRGFRVSEECVFVDVLLMEKEPFVKRERERERERVREREVLVGVQGNQPVTKGTR